MVVGSSSCLDETGRETPDSVQEAFDRIELAAREPDLKTRATFVRADGAREAPIARAFACRIKYMINERMTVAITRHAACVIACVYMTQS
jgi:hypothetical protein